MGVTVAEVELSDNSKEILEALGEQIGVALAAIGAEAEGYAKENCPVDTGRLRNSISFATSTAHENTDTPKQSGDDDMHGTPEEGAVYIGTNVEYAEQIEYSEYPHKVGRAHFLRDAAATHGDHYKAILEAYLKSQ